MRGVLLLQAEVLEMCFTYPPGHASGPFPVEQPAYMECPLGHHEILSRPKQQPGL